MNKYQQFFSDKTIEFAEELYKYTDEELKNTFKEQKENRDSILRIIAMIILKYNINDKACLNLSNNEFKALYKDLKLTVAKIFKSEYDKENKGLMELLILVGTEKYLSSSFLLSLGLNFNIKKMDMKKLKAILNTKVDGMNFSERIWGNKTDKVAKALQKEIKDFLEGKISINDVESVIKHRFNVNASYSKRLVENEVSRTMNEVNEEWAREHNIKFQMWMATLDNKTSEICQGLDGKTWAFDDPNKPMPITDSHVGCRCTLADLPSKDYKPNLRINNNTKQDINWTTYKEWKEKEGL